MLQKIFHTPWHLMRWVRLIVGVWAVLNFIKASSTSTIEYLILGVGLYFVYKALFNSGCEVVNNYIPTDEEETTTIDYEEIK